MARREATPAAPGSRALVVDLIRSSGPISRVELTSATGLTQPSISLIVRKLLTDGIVRETGSTASGGKPRQMLEINTRARIGVGVQLGFESITFVATDAGGGVLARQQIRGAALAAPEEVTRRIVDGYAAFVRGTGLDRRTIAGVAVVAPGPIDQAAGRILGPPTLQGWRDFPLREELGAGFGIPILLDNDAAAAAIGEFWSRGVSRHETFGSIYIGTGIGAGIVLDGALFRGASSNAAEIGHITIAPGGRECFCGNIGCLERYAAPSVVVEDAGADRGSFADLDLTFEVEQNARDFDVLSLAAINGHPAAEALLQRSAGHLADGAVTLANLFDLDALVLTGPGVAIAGSIYTRALRSRLEARRFARRAHPISVELSANPRDAAAIGASSLVLQSTLSPGHGPVLHQPA
ncbi:ROK family transcriptional regulator [Rathayibacter festucae]|uniref:ROK family protein n=1 Tax=Rathayibacter festucae TaxID=110937 RepID=A0ABX6H449_9MICO|nr:ROK family transcriptional regulator [Rathayibacter festucae]MDY0913596.1 ROK family transcriptional regulator [Rathayibacter festucae]QHC64561.1 ROK family protein [Rathayibacter festucae]